MSGQSQVPRVIAAYFDAHAVAQTAGETIPAHPVIAQQFVPGRGWVRPDHAHRVSPSWCRKLARGGVTGISVTIPGTRIRADFNICEAVR